MMKNILVLVAHYDDELISCGGFIKQKIEVGHNITVVSVTHKGDVWRVKWEKVCLKLGVKNFKSLILPLWINKERKELAKINRHRFNDKLKQEDIYPNDFDLILTHGCDGDIDRHLQHRQLYILANEYKPEKLCFVAYPRTRVKREHPMYKHIENRAHWEAIIKKGFLPWELISLSNYICKLSEEDVRLKEECMKIYFPNQDSYPAVHYPFELFRYSGRRSLWEL